MEYEIKNPKLLNALSKNNWEEIEKILSHSSKDEILTTILSCVYLNKSEIARRTMHKFDMVGGYGDILVEACKLSRYDLIDFLLENAPSIENENLNDKLQDSLDWIIINPKGQKRREYIGKILNTFDFKSKTIDSSLGFLISIRAKDKELDKSLIELLLDKSDKSKDKSDILKKCITSHDLSLVKMIHPYCKKDNGDMLNITCKIINTEILSFFLENEKYDFEILYQAILKSIFSNNSKMIDMIFDKVEDKDIDKLLKNIKKDIAWQNSQYHGPEIKTNYMEKLVAERNKKIMSQEINRDNRTLKKNKIKIM